LTIALARMRGDPVLSQGPVARPAGETLRRRLARRLKAVPLRVYLGAALSSVLIGIGVNALILQRERHPAPFFRPATPADSSAAPGPAAPLPPQLATADRDASAAEVSPASPPVRPAGAVDSSPSRAADPITDLLREEARADVARLILTAQTALVRLGYPVKPDGNEGVTTQQALRDFERVHGLPLSTEITPRLVKQLVMAARAAGR
jgi:Putative peptidoglycan binding domain